MPDNKEEDYLDKLLSSMNEKENQDEIDEEEQLIKEQVQEAVSKTNSQQEKDKSLAKDNVIQEKSPEEVARLARQEMEENEKNEKSESEKEAQADAKLDELLENTPVEEASLADITAQDNAELTDSDMQRLMNMKLDDIIDDVKSDSISVDELFGNSGSGQNEQDTQDSNESTGNTDVQPEQEKAGTSDTNEDEESQDLANAAIQELTEKDKHNKKKKKGFFGKLKKIFIDSLEDEPIEDDGQERNDEEKPDNEAVTEESDEPKDENEQIIEDVFGDKDTLDDSEAPKKGFFARFKYRLAQLKAKRAEEEKAEEEAERLDEEESRKKKEQKKAAAAEKKEQKKQDSKDKKAAKPKKTKESKPKKEKKPKEPPKPGDILKIKPLSMIMFVLFVAGIVVLVCVLNSSVNYDTAVSQAKTYYANGDYSKAYSKLNGMKLSGSDKTLYEQASTIMYVNRQYESYQNYMKLDMKTEALDALIKGIDRYETYKSDAAELGIDDKYTEQYNMIIKALQDTFKISEAEGISLAEQSADDFTNYYYKIKEYGKAAQ